MMETETHGHALPMAGQHSCRCGEATSETPELDARTIPHAVRHGAVLGALDGLKAGASLIVVAHHDPVPLLKQVDDRFGMALTRTYVEEGPDAWKVMFTRV